MKINIPYGKKILEVEIQENNILGIIEPNIVPVGDEWEIIQKGVENGIDSKSFNEFISDANNLLFIVNDHTRPTPTAKILKVIYDKIRNKNVKFLIATGIHRRPNEEELNFIFGEYYNVLKDRIYIHDAKKDEEMVYLGTSSFGTEMYVNKLAVEVDKLVVISSVEPHYFAGYTGGRKSFLPGIASYKTIEQNHKLALLPEANSLILEGNPVHQDMVEAIKMIRGIEIYSIQTVVDGNQRVYSCISGDIHKSFYLSVEKSYEVFGVNIKEKADVVVSIARYPLDIDLYQSQKAIDNGKLALKEGGILILVSECREGIGEETYFNLLSSSKTPQEVLERIKKDYKLGYHKAAKMAEILTWAEIWGITALKDKDIESVFIRPFHNIQEAIDEALAQKGNKAKILFLMDGGFTVPTILQM